MLYKDWDIALSGKNIRITAVTIADKKAFFRRMFGEKQDRYSEDSGTPPSAETNQARTHAEDEEMHAIRLKNDHKLIGLFSLQRDPYGRPDIGITLFSDYQNKGYGPEAVALFCNYLHTAYGLECIYARIQENNTQSRRAIEKVGAVLDEVKPQPKMQELADRILSAGGVPSPVSRWCWYHIDLPIGEYSPEMTEDICTG